MKIFNKNGFTFIELMIVVAIIGVVAAIAAPNFSQYMAQRRINGAAREIYADLAFVRTQAISMSRWVALKIDANDQYTIFHDDNRDGIIDAGETISTKGLHPNYYDVTFSTPPGASIVFYPNGTGSTGTLYIAGPAGSKSIIISSAGRVRIN